MPNMLGIPDQGGGGHRNFSPEHNAQIENLFKYMHWVNYKKSLYLMISKASSYVIQKTDVVSDGITYNAYAKQILGQMTALDIY